VERLQVGPGDAKLGFVPQHRVHDTAIRRRKDHGAAQVKPIQT
jgi:hypothetical protein